MRRHFRFFATGVAVGLGAVALAAPADAAFPANGRIAFQRGEDALEPGRRSS